MKISVICFTVNGAKIAGKIKTGLEAAGYEAAAWCKKKEYVEDHGESGGENRVEDHGESSVENRAEDHGVRRLAGSLKQWTEEAFADSQGLIFVGATGIAVRSIAPFLKGKTLDPAVLAVDEKGKFVISLISGHIGGANRLCGTVAKLLEAVPVITTATDLNGIFAVDVFARDNGLVITDMQLAKQISAELLDGGNVGFCSQFPWSGQLPEGLVVQKEERAEETQILMTDIVKKREEGSETEKLQNQEEGSAEMWASRLKYGIYVAVDTAPSFRSIAPHQLPWSAALHLIPRIAVLGVGCRRGKSAEELENFLLEFLKSNHVDIRAVCRVCSIDVKAQEPGILEFCKKYGIAYEVYSANQLKAVQGEFSASAFVAGQVGVDNVCERSAVLGSGGGQLAVKKMAGNGMTAALALREWRMRFE